MYCAGWTYSAIASVHPKQGQRGTVITIKGIGLFAGGAKVARVKLSSADAARVLTQSPTEITAEVSSVFVRVPPRPVSRSGGKIDFV